MTHKFATKSLAAAAVMLTLPAGALLGQATAAAKTRPHHRPAGHHQRKHHARTVRFMAQVVRASAKGLIVRTASGQIMSFSTEQILRASLPPHHKRHQRGRGHKLQRMDLTLSSGNVVLNILGLQPGATIQITETIDDSGNVTITIQLPAQPVESSATGVINELNTDTFTVTAPDGSELRFAMPSVQLSAANLQTCDIVDVSYHQDGGLLVADSVNATGQSSDGSCAPSGDVSGTISAISDSSVTVSSDSGPVTVAVDPTSGLTAGYQLGDLVDVSYTQNADGSLSATNIQFVEENTSGHVTSVTTAVKGGSLTITDDNSGAAETFLADPNNGVQINAFAFNGVSVGDEVGIQYHESAGQLVADVVSEQ